MLWYDDAFQIANCTRIHFLHCFAKYSSNNIKEKYLLFIVKANKSNSLVPHQTSKTKASAALGTKRHKEGKNPIIVILLAFNVKVIWIEFW